MTIAILVFLKKKEQTYLTIPMYNMVLLYLTSSPCAVTELHIHIVAISYLLYTY